MKRITSILLAIGFVAICSTAMAAMSTSKVRKNTRFLTDRMAYELNLSPAQYNDVYEINFDFIYNIRYLMNDVMRGYEWALDDYYQMLDIRNDDLRWVLSSSQYARFLGTEYFYRPVYASGNSWNFRVYIVYNNPNFFYFGKPAHYRSYSGGHYRTHYNNSYYRNKYHHDIYNGQFSTKQDKVYYDNRHKDFGISTRPSGNSTQGNSTRPNLNSRPSNGNRPNGNAATRPSSSNSSGTNSSRPNTSARPSSSSTGSSSRPGSNSVRTESNSSQQGNSSSTRPGSSSSQSNSNSSRPNSSSSRSSSSNSRSNSSTPKSNNNSTRSKSSSKVSERPSSNSNRNSSSNRSNSSSSSRSSSERSNSGGRR